ncbi:MAG: sigma-70 family RNA polymerase sigma factor [Prevotellaceae bacterium]|jgi:RNA polymerase sigma-70 factor (ECF subfamily)|nr:sigma-70 family RNA polymerase sigma factor [Prevotellaceae bacterium]
MMNKQEQQALEADFIGMIQAHRRIIYKVCSCYVTDRSPLEDLYQESVLNLWKSYPKFRRESAPSTWIYRVALNTCISDLRKNDKFRRHVPLACSAETAFEQESIEEELKELYRCIRQLKTLERAIILLYLEEKSYQEIADITGLSRDCVATRLRRIKVKLKLMSNY